MYNYSNIKHLVDPAICKTIFSTFETDNLYIDAGSKLICTNIEFPLLHIQSAMKENNISIIYKTSKFSKINLNTDQVN